MKPNIISGFLKRGILFALMAAVVLIVSVNVYSSTLGVPGTDPAVEPIPEFDFDDPAKSMVVRLDFNGPLDVTFDKAIVSMQRAHARISDPPLLRVKLYTDTGAFIEQFNAWHPLWAFVEGADGTESRVILPSASGRFVFPFRPDLGTMKVVDVPLYEELIEVDLRPTIREFCETHPDDPDCKVADLAILGISAVDAPPLVLVGQSASITVRTIIVNHGPDAPIDADVTRTATTSAGVSVTPQLVNRTEPALGVNLPRVLDQVYTVTCLAPGDHTITFLAEIDPHAAAVADLVPANDSRQVQLTVDCAIPVTINIKPGSDVNPINRTAQGGIPIAVLTTAAGEHGNPLAFDATRIAPLSVRFGRPDLVAAGGSTSAELHQRGHIEDALELDESTRDGDMDMVLHFGPDGAGLTPSDTRACIKGTLIPDGGNALTFFGCDSIQVIK